MTSPLIALRQSVRDYLSQDATLKTLLNSLEVFDEAPRAATPPYVTFGDFQVKDWSTSTDIGFEILWDIDVWSIQTSSKEALIIAEQIRHLLQDVTLALTGFNLISNTQQSAVIKRENNARYISISTKYRSTLEMLS